MLRQVSRLISTLRKQTTVGLSQKLNMPTTIFVVPRQPNEFGLCQKEREKASREESIAKQDKKL